jgi:hypothetical protein
MQQWQRKAWTAAAVQSKLIDPCLRSAGLQDCDEAQFAAKSLLSVG